MGIGSSLKKLLDEKKVNVNELSRCIGVSSSTIYSIIKRDNMKADFELLIRICDALDTDISYFYDKGTRKKPFLMSKDEERLILSYRCASADDRIAVEAVLRKYPPATIHKSIPVYRAAKSVDKTCDQIMLAPEEMLRRLKDAPETDDEF